MFLLTVFPTNMSTLGEDGPLVDTYSSWSMKACVGACVLSDQAEAMLSAEGLILKVS